MFQLAHFHVEHCNYFQFIILKIGDLSSIFFAFYYTNPDLCQLCAGHPE